MTTIIILLVVGALSFTIGSICNSVMDVIDHDFQGSIFNKWIKKPKARLWWCENQGWLNKYIDRDPAKGRIKWKICFITFNKPVQICDAWHHFKMWMIIFCANGIALPITFLIDTGLSNFLEWSIYMLLLGLFWNKPFVWFYHHILRIK